MRVWTDGRMTLEELWLRDVVSVKFIVEIHEGGIFLFIQIFGLINGKEEKINFYLLERDSTGQPKRNVDLGLGLSPKKLPITKDDKMSLAEIFTNSDGKMKSIISKLEKKLVRMIVMWWSFSVEIKNEKITFKLVDDSREYITTVLTSTRNLSELKKFCYE